MREGSGTKAGELQPKNLDSEVSSVGWGALGGFCLGVKLHANSM